MAPLRVIFTLVAATLILAPNAAWARPTPAPGHELSTVSLAVRHATSAAPWASPTAEHPLGTVLVASLDEPLRTSSLDPPSRERIPTVREIDVARGDIMATQRLAKSVTGYGLRIAATPRGAIVISGGSDEDYSPARIWILDRRLRVKTSLALGRDATDGNASADGDTAVLGYRFWTTINGEQRHREGVETFSLSSGARLGRTAFDQGPMPPRGERWSQVVASGSRVYLLSRGAGIDVYAFAPSLRRLFAQYHRKMSDEFRWDGHAALVVGMRGVVVAGDDWATHLSRDLSREALVAAWPEEGLGNDRVQPAQGSADGATGRLLLDTGFVAPTLTSLPERVAQFSREPYCPRGTCEDAVRPYFDDEPVAAFWLAGRATIVTRGTALRIVVVDP